MSESGELQSLVLPSGVFTGDSEGGGARRRRWAPSCIATLPSLRRRTELENMAAALSGRLLLASLPTALDALLVYDDALLGSKQPTNSSR